MDLLRSLPLGLYLEHPFTWMHRLDPRVKMAWLMGFLVTPILANPLWRLAMVFLLIALTLAASIPLRVWKQQMGWLLLLGSLVFLLTTIAPDGLPNSPQPRRPHPALVDLPEWVAPQSGKRFHWNPLDSPSDSPQSSSPQPESPDTQPLENLPGETLTIPPATVYRYVLFNPKLFNKFSITVTRRSLDLGIRISTLIFTLIYSTTLFLLTTSPEEITAGLEDIFAPLGRFGLPITEITLTLTLSLRFIPLVLEEVQNLVRSVWTRAINWKKLGLRQGFLVWLRVAERLLLNLLLRSEQIAGAIQVRGFTTADRHQVPWHDLRLQSRDAVALIGLAALFGGRLIWGG
ncbi:MAG: energy-coupling factor transporter transmembrane component T family protein [Prochlorotrichaceae cyanobacterium]